MDGGSGVKLVGDGAERPGLEGLAREMGLAERVVFTGHLQGPGRILGAAADRRTYRAPDSKIPLAELRPALDRKTYLG